MDARRRLVFKIAGQDEWTEAVRRGRYEGSADDARDGFIHLSSADQIEGTLARHFAGRAGLILVAFDEAVVAACLKWEPSRNGALYPHVYGTLDPGTALWAEPIGLDPAGRHRLPPRSFS